MGQSEAAAAALARKYFELTGMTQEAVAFALSEVMGRRVSQSQVSEHMRGIRWSNPDLPGAYVKVLGIPADEMAEAMGYPLPGKAPRRWTIKDVVKADPTLSAAAKRHLLNQYQLLQDATQHSRTSTPIRRKQNK